MSRKVIVVVGLAVTAIGVLSSLAVGALFTAGTLHVRPRLGVVLSAWWMQPPARTGDCVIVLHGIGDSRVGSSGFAPMFLAEGYSALFPDSRGHGASGGQYVTYGLLERYDVIAWTRWMRTAGCREIFGLGESLGASVLIEAAAIEPVFRAIVAECPYADLRSVADYRIGKIAGPFTGWVIGSGALYARWVDGFDLFSVSPIEAIVRTSTPVLLIHGLADDRTPPVNSIRLARANPRAQLWLVPNAGHTGASSAAPEEFRRRVLAWPNSSRPAAATPASKP